MVQSGFVPLEVSGKQGFQMRPLHVIFAFLSAGMICGSAIAQEEPVRPKDMPNYCFKVALDTFALKPNKVKVKKAAEADGNFSVSGTADQGANGKRAFHCSFDTEGKFVGMAVEGTGSE